jgi:hypothetical protein
MTVLILRRGGRPSQEEYEHAHKNEWGQADVRSAIACCLLEHLLEHHFDALFPRVRRAALASPRFADTFSSCWAFGQTNLPKNIVRFERLMRQLFNRRLRRERSGKAPSD